MSKTGVIRRRSREPVEVIPAARADNFKVAVIDALRMSEGDDLHERLWEAVIAYQGASDQMQPDTESR